MIGDSHIQMHQLTSLFFKSNQMNVLVVDYTGAVEEEYHSFHSNGF